ncbi:MAG: proline racemase family protein [Acidobacteriota bacterium]
MLSERVRRVQVVDSHTGGEPTRVVVAGGPELGAGSMAERLALFRERHEDFRSAVDTEPRGSDVKVGALLGEPIDSACAAGVIFFNNVGYLGMCGHGTIGLIVTLAYLGRIGPGEHFIETPVGRISARLHESGEVSVFNVQSYRYRESVTVDVPGIGPVTGDIAWGGNWFFLIEEHGQALSLDRVDELTDFTSRIMAALAAAGITGEGGQLIDHIELFGPPSHPYLDSRNFVLCPGKSYDRSPCGTGTSAKMASLHASGKLHPGQIWRQESIVGSVFEGYVTMRDDRVYPTIKGTAYVNAESTLILDERDPFCMGIRR